MPNLEHWSFAARLLQGTWDYEPSGLFDQTHLRWFTQESFGRQLRALGLVPYDVQGRVFDRDQPARFAAALGPALEALGVDRESYLGRATPLQYVWRVGKQPRSSLTVAGTMLKPVGGVSHVRVIHPLAATATDPAITVHLGQLPELGPDAPKICVLHRPA